MKLKKMLSLILVILLASFITGIIFPSVVRADGVEVTDIITDMSGANTKPSGYTTSGGIGKVINMIIGLLQVAGTGISVIMVTWLGIKYIVASIEEKAEIKKQAVPIVIGAVLLFGAVNLMAALEEFADSTVNTD